MLEFTEKGRQLVGPKGTLPVADDDEVLVKLAMLYEGDCEGLGPNAAAEKFGFTRQWYHTLRKRFREQGIEGLKSSKTGPKTNYRRTGEVTRQVIRYRSLDSDVSVEVIAQRLRQNGMAISNRSVERIIAEYGLQKKTPSGRSQTAQGPSTDPSDQTSGAS